MHTLKRFFVRSRLGRQSGFSIIEAMIAAGLLGGLALFVTSLTRNGMVGQKTASALNEARDITNGIANGLTTQAACLNTFGGIDPQAGASVNEIKDTNGVVQYQVGKTYGSKTIKLIGIAVGGTGIDAKTGIQRYTASGPNAGLAMVIVNWQKTAETNGPAAIPRFFFMNVTTDANGKLNTCMAAANGMSDTIWQRNPSDLSKIFYNDGNVGIGTSSARVTLDVNGPVRSGNATVGDTCALEGSTAYDATAHAPLYCDQTSKWAKSKGLTACVVRSIFGGYGTSQTCKAGEIMTGGGGGTNSTYHYLGAYYTSPTHGSETSTDGMGVNTTGGNEEAYWSSASWVICCT